MRVLLAANASYVPPRGGATRCNLAWLGLLAQSGVQCRAVCAALPAQDPEGRNQFASENLGSQWSVSEHAGGFTAHGPGIAVFAVSAPGALARELRRQCEEFRPDWVLVSSEDLSHLLLREAHRCAPGRVVYLAHTPQFFPFGPESWNPESDGVELVTAAAGVVVIGRSMAEYVRTHAHCEATVIHPPIYGDPPFPNLACHDRGLITMINPCALKGVAIFLALADRFPQFPFGALPGWGTTTADRTEIRKRPNIVWLSNPPRIRHVLAQTRVLLMPSLWYEGLGLIVVEAMLHGIPVIASDRGGLAEAKAGTGFLIPVPAVRGYERVFDERGLPRLIIDPPDIEPWAEALRTLLEDPTAYRAESERSRRAALNFVENLRPDALRDFLEQLRPAPSRPVGHTLLGRRPPEKSALLLQLLRERGRKR